MWFLALACHNISLFNYIRFLKSCRLLRRCYYFCDFGFKQIVKGTQVIFLNLGVIFLTNAS